MRKQQGYTGVSYSAQISRTVCVFGGEGICVECMLVGIRVCVIIVVCVDQYCEYNHQVSMP